MLFKRSKNCSLFSIIVCVFCVLFSVFLNVNNTYAASFATSSLRLLRRPVSFNSYSWSSNLAYHDLLYNTWSAKQYEFTSASFIPTGDYASLHFETNLVYYEYGAYQNPWVNLNTIGIWCSASTGGVSVKDYLVSTAVTHWYGSNNENNTTLTVYGDVALQGFSRGNSTTLSCGVGSSDYAFLQVWPEGLNTTNYFYFEQNPATIDFTDNVSETLLQQQINQNQTIINQNNEYYSHEYDAVDNISNQDTSDIPNSTDQQTTNLIGVISSFITAIGGINATNCQLTLPFPTYAGGSTTVDVCQGKEKAPQLVQIGSSMLLLLFFLPLAWLLLKLIYNEIRSWTNG